MILRFCLTLFILILFFKNSFSEEIPIIVIAPSKINQSYSSVGTSVTSLSNKTIQETEKFFLAEVLNESLPGMNYFRSGGYGTVSGIQLRGLPKRYSTVYIDGVKMSDPSTSDNSFHFSNIMTSSIDTVEILRGSNSSIYGSGAIGGTVHITTKKGEPGFKKDVNYATGSHGTHNLSTSVSGGDESKNYYIGLQRFQTDGISQMDHNSEKDRYKNNGLVASFSDKFSDTLELQSNVRVAETYLQ